METLTRLPLRMIVLIVLGGSSAAVSDAWLSVGARGPYAVIWLLILLSGAMWLVPSWERAWCGWITVVAALLHTAVLLRAASHDARTFYGGAGTCIIGMYCWLLVAVALLVTTILGRLLAPKPPRAA
jgi:hypothetical protein